MKDEQRETYPPPKHVPIDVGTPTVGLWCDTCLLPSVYEVPVHCMTERGVTTVGVAHACTHCGAAR